MHYYQHNIGDHKKLTAHFSVLELGAYSLMLDRYFDTEAPLLADESRLFRLLRLSSTEEQQAGRRVLQDIFTLTEAGWRHFGCDKAITHFRSKSAQSARAAKLRWDKENLAKASSQPGLFNAGTASKDGRGDGYHEYYERGQFAQPPNMVQPISGLASGTSVAAAPWAEPAGATVVTVAIEATGAAPVEPVPPNLSESAATPSADNVPSAGSSATITAALCPQCQCDANALRHSAPPEAAPTAPRPQTNDTHAPKTPIPPVKPAFLVPPPCQPDANALPTSKPITVDSKRPSPSRERASATRLPAHWQPGEQDILFCRTERPELNPHEVAARFRDYWIAAPDKNGKKADWPATWRNWVRSEHKARTPAYRNIHEQRLDFVQQLTGQTHHEPRIIDINPSPANSMDQIPFQ